LTVWLTVKSGGVRVLIKKGVAPQIRRKGTAFVMVQTQGVEFIEGKHYF